MKINEFINHKNLNRIKMNKLIISSFLILIFLTQLVFANLGTYEPGQKVNIRFMCLTNSGGTDSGCSSPNVTILDPDNVFYAPTTIATELDDSVLPGLWNSSFNVPTGAFNGTWLVRINISNSNTTVSSTVIPFQVVDNGFNNLQKNFTTLHDRVAEVSVGSKANISALNTTVWQLNTSITTEDSGTKVWTYGGSISTFIRDLINEIWSSTAGRIITASDGTNITKPTFQGNLTGLTTNLTGGDKVQIARNVWNFSDLNNPTPGRRITNGVEG